MTHATKSNYAVHPGESLLDVLESYPMTQKELSERMNVTKKHVNSIITGASPITPDTAVKLEFVLGIPAGFWLGMQNNYDEVIARQRANAELKKETALLKKYCYSEMAKKNWIENASTDLERVEVLRKYFAVENLLLVENVMNIAPSFRKSEKFKTSPYAIRSWLRKGQIEASKIETEPFSKANMDEIIESIRNIIKDGQQPNEMVKKIREILAKKGIAFVTAAHLKNTSIQGAAYWLSPKKAVIQASYRYCRADILWFTLFHELCHVLKHKKKFIHVDIDEKSGEDQKKELEADTFAANTLIPKRAYEAFIQSKSNISRKDISTFANSVGTHAGVVVGRLQREDHLDPNQYNDMIMRLDPEDVPCV